MIYESISVVLSKSLQTLGLELPFIFFFHDGRNLISFVEGAFLVSVLLCEIISPKVLPFVSHHHILSSQYLR